MQLCFIFGEHKKYMMYRIHIWHRLFYTVLRFKCGLKSETALWARKMRLNQRDGQCAQHILIYELRLLDLNFKFECAKYFWKSADTISKYFFRIDTSKIYFNISSVFVLDMERVYLSICPKNAGISDTEI